MISLGLLCEEMGCSCECKKGFSGASLRTTCHLWQSSEEHCTPDVPLQASGDRLQIPGVRAPGDRSQKIPQWLKPFEEGLFGERRDSHSVVVVQPAVVPRETTLDAMRVSSEEE